MKASKMHEVRKSSSGYWIISHKSNGSITYYADSKEDAEQTLREWDAAPQLLEALRNMTGLITSLKLFGQATLMGEAEDEQLAEAIQVIEKATT